MKFECLSVIRDGKGSGHIILQNSLNQKVVTHFLILIDRGMQEEDVCVFSEPQEMKMISPPPLLIDFRLQTTKDFQLCPLFLIRSVGIPGFVCCPVTSLRALCLISWPGRNLIFI